MPIAPPPESGGGSGGGRGRWAKYDGWLIGPTYSVDVSAYDTTRWYGRDWYTSTSNATTSSSYNYTWSSTTTEWTTLTWRGSRLVITEDSDTERAAALAAREARSEQRSQQVELERQQRASERAVANGRALHLLSQVLDEAQQTSYRLDGFFEVIGSHGTLYRLHRGTSGNVEWVKPDGSMGGRLCAHPSMAESWLPTEDVLLAQMLALRTDEREFCRVANVHAGSRPPLAIMAA